MPAETAEPKDSPLTKAWEEYKASEAFTNSKAWALRIAPLVQAGDPDADRWLYELMPSEQRERYVVGALWAAFSTGFGIAKETPR